MKKVTNLTIIANFIDRNPGCRRVDIKRHLFRVREGRDGSTYEVRCKSNQYFQQYGSASNVYLDRLWYNEIKNMRHKKDTYWSRIRDVNRPGKSSYQLTAQGRSYVNHNINRNLPKGELVSCYIGSHRSGSGIPFYGLVLECTDTGGVWVYGHSGTTKYFNHHASIIRRHG